MALYLVTGAAGFIGSALAHALVEKGEEVRGLDNLSTGKLENLAAIVNNIDFREGDLLDVAAVEDACKGIDFVLHQAAIPSVPRSIIDPVLSHAANVTGTVNLLVACRNAGVKRVVFASSSSLYGEAPVLPKHEGILPDPISPYAVNKLSGEMYMKSFYRVYGLETVSLRYFNVFGPRQDPNSQYSGVLAKFITKMLAGERPTIFGDGEQSRDFTYVENVVQANLLSCTAPAAEVAGHALNIALGERITLNETFVLLQKLLGYEGHPIYEPERAGDIKHSLADITLAKKRLGYDPKVGFEEGLRQTIAWCREQGDPCTPPLLARADNL